MTILTATCYLLAADADPAALVAGIAGPYEPVPAPPRPLRQRHLDSFDWRLHGAGLTLVRTDGTWELRGIADGQPVATEPAGPGPWPRFPDQFAADGKLGPSLARLLKLRALLHLITLVGQEQRWRVLDADRKTVLRLAVQTLALEKPARDGSWRLLWLWPLRGYEEVADAAAARAADSGLTALSAPPLDALLRAAGLEPGSYSSRFVADLAPGQPALAAATRICQILLRTMRQNESGLKADIDTEFLHDFRVAIRRTRSALVHFKGVFDADALAPMRDDLRDLGRLTGPLRDLDVYLLDEPRYRALLPDDLQPGLDRLFARLRAEREVELGRLRAALADPAYRQFVARWGAFLADPPPGPAASLPVLDLVRTRLRKRHRRVVRDGYAIDDRSPAAALHALRIECKKLRYLLEFANSLYPPGEVDALIKQLKDLQDNLGEFNDLSVQHVRLREHLETIGGRGRAALAEAAAIGGLIVALDARQAHVRTEFAAAFAAFSGAKVAARFARLTGAAPAPEEPV